MKDKEAFREHYMDTISCSHPYLARWNKKGSNEYPVNCGYCYPCLIRKSSLIDVEDIKYSFEAERRLLDTHFHLDMYKDYMEKYRYIVDKEQYTLRMANSPGVFLRCKNMFQNNKYVKFALGSHPMNSKLKESDLRVFFICFLTHNMLVKLD